MVKISIKKEEKTIKPRQKQKQKQSQKVVVNIGNDVVKPKRKRAPRQTLQKNRVVNKQQTGPTQINVPQAMPLQQSKAEPMNEFIKYFKENERNKEIAKQNESTNELIKYLKETEKQKEIIKEKETKINELEKDKKDKERSKVLTTDEVQDDFSRVYSNSNISTLTNSGTATPRLSRSVDPSQLYDLLRRESDLRGGNPNSGQITFATLQSNEPSSNSSLSSNNSENTFTTRATNNTKQSNLSSLSSQSNDLSTYMTQSPPKEPTETQMQSPYEELLEDEIEAQQVVSPEVVAAVEDPVIDEILEEEPENQVVVYEPQRATAQTATATQQLIGIENSTLTAFLRQINTPIPTMHLKDIIGLRPTVAETTDMRQKRIDKLDKKTDKEPDKKPLLAIEDEPIDIPKFTAEELKAYKDKTKESRKAEAVVEENKEPAAQGVEGYEDFVKYISNKNTYNWMLANILIKNGITDPKTGNGFYVAEIKDPKKKKDTKKQVARMHGSTNTLDKTYLSELLRKKYNDGLIKNYLN